MLGTSRVMGAPQSLAPEKCQCEEPGHGFARMTLERGSHFSVIKMMTSKKQKITASKEGLKLSGVPARPLQEGLFRDRGLDIGSWPRWLVTASLILHPSSGRMLERPLSSSNGEDRDVVDVIHLCSNNEIKAELPVRPSPAFGPALCPDDRGSGVYFFQRHKDREREGELCCSLRLADSTSKEQVCSVACLASCSSPEHQLWPFATYCVTKVTVLSCCLFLTFAHNSKLHVQCNSSSLILLKLC